MRRIFKNLVPNESKREDELPKFEFDTNYERIQIKKPIENETDTVSVRFQSVDKKENMAEIDREHVNKLKGFERLCRESLVDFLRKIKLQKTPDMKVKFLFIDRESSILFRRLITWLEMKDSDISCVFILNEDQVSNNLTENGNLFYMVSTHYLNNFRREFTKELKSRKCLKKNIYLREPRNYLNKEQIKFINKIVQITKSEMNFLNIYMPINESIILIDNSRSTLQWLVQQLKPTQPQKNGKQPKSQKYCNHLAYLLFKNNLNPCIRYLNNFNAYNKTMAENTFQILQQFYEFNNTLEMADANCLLLIIDRSIDFLTPVLHSNNYYQFVNQELEIVLGADFTTLGGQLEDAALKEVAEHLIAISKQLSLDQMKITDSKTIGQLALYDRKANLLAKHIDFVNQVRNRLSNGYQHFVTIEEQLLYPKVEGAFLKSQELASHVIGDNSKKINQPSGNEQLTKNHAILTELIDLDQKEFIIFLKKIFENEKNPLDWKRILCLYSVIKGPLLPSVSKLLKNVLTKDMKREIENFIGLLKKIGERNEFGKSVKFVSLASLIRKAYANALDEQKYPTVNSSTPNPKKLLIFMSGGISFNELKLVKKTDTILISDCILYPRLFLDLLI